VRILQAPIQPVFVWNFIAGTVLPALYIFSIIGIMNKLVLKGFPQDLSRKVIHIAAGSWIWCWPLLDPSDGWSYVFNISVPALWTLLFLVKGFTASPDDPAVKTMTRTGNPKELLLGPLFFTLSMEFIGVFYFMTKIGVITMGYLGWGDGLSAWVGSRYGKRKYKLLGRKKSIEGSLTVLFAGFIGSLLLYIIVFQTLPGFNLLLKMLMLGIIAMIVEAISPSDVDNLLIPAAMILCWYFLPF